MRNLISQDEWESRFPHGGECSSCGFETEALQSYPNHRTQYDDAYTDESRRKWICALCASTAAGSALDYPTHYPEGTTLKTICYVGNVILAALRRPTEHQEEPE